MMKKLLSGFSLLFFFISCEREYDGTTRYVFDTQVLDKNNQPLANIPVQLYFNSYYSFFGNQDDGNVFMTTKTDSNGNVRLVFPFPTQNSNAVGIIEIGESTNYNSDNNNFTFINFQPSNFTNFYLRETPVTLFSKNELVNFQTIVNNTTINKSVSNIEIEGSQFIPFKDFLANNQNNYYQNFAKLEKNQTIILKYTVTDYQFNPATTEVISVSIDVLETDLNYTITIN
jgi:hypothetical protein